MKPSLKVLFLAAEADPWVKVGGLGDVAGSLPAAIRQLPASQGEGFSGIDIRLALPLHGGLKRRAGPFHEEQRFNLPYKGGHTQIKVFTRGQGAGDLPVYFIGGDLIPPDGAVYTADAEADCVKFTAFSLAALEMARRMDWKPDLIHANDWHTAPAIYSLKGLKKVDPCFSDAVTLLGLHNLPYLGAGAGAAMEAFARKPPKAGKLPKWARDLPLPLGLLYTDQIVPVSPTYAQEILTPSFGAGLDKFLRQRAGRIKGILNGLDVQQWNPKIDAHLEANYDRDSLQKRVANKAALQAEFELAQNPDLPLLALIARMDIQKGVDLLPEALRLLTSSLAFTGLPWQAVILGTGDPQLEAEARQLQRDFPRRVRAAIRFDGALSRRIYAGADILLIPSRYEPCGLAQMIAMHYGCVPVAHATGGLRDTIWDYEDETESTGFLFDQPAPEALALALGRALRVYNDQQAWMKLQRRGMAVDFSWQHSASAYLDLYTSLVGKDEA